jgi:hypothetical protein
MAIAETGPWRSPKPADDDRRTRFMPITETGHGDRRNRGMPITETGDGDRLRSVVRAMPDLR